MEREVLSEKREYIAIDYFRFFCSLLVIAIHLSPLYSVNTEVSFWFRENLYRIAVPFFFVTAGYFATSKMHDGKKMAQYVKRLLLLYLLYTILHLPQILNNFFFYPGDWKYKIFAFAKAVVFTGTYAQLWYFAGLITAVVVIYILLNKCKISPKGVLLLSGILYVIGVLGSAYKQLFCHNPVLGKIMGIYYQLCDTTRNGWFFGMFLVMTGVYIGMHKDKIKKRCYWPWVVLFFLLMHVESYIVRRISVTGEYDLTFSMAATAILLFLALAFVNVSQKYEKRGIWLRKISVLMFGLHLLADYYISVLENIAGIYFNNLQNYMIVVVVTFVVSGILVYLSKYKYFSWIKYLY